MELKGIIKEGENKSLTCCSSIADIVIGEVSLFDELEKLFNQDAEEYFSASYDNPRQSPKYGVKYVILDEAPNEEKSFNDLSAEVQINMLYADYYSGCYSEYTCGYGGFDYVLGKDGEGHSVFDELKSYIGKYVHFQI
jgi:hypothetical protein